MRKQDEDERGDRDDDENEEGRPPGEIPNDDAPDAVEILRGGESVEWTELRVLPVFPLPNVVLFPRVTLPLYVFEERYKTMVDDALGDDRLLCISLGEQEGGGESGRDPVPREVCSIGRISQVEQLDDGEKNIIVTGLRRARIVEVVERRPYLVARVESFEEEPSDKEQLAACREVARLAIEWLFFEDQEGAERCIERLNLIHDPGYLADFIAYHLIEDASIKQDVLEIRDTRRRLARVRVVVQAAVERAKENGPQPKKK